MGRVFLMAFIVGFGLAACTGEGGQAPTGPVVNFTNRCQDTAGGGRGGDRNGDTTISIDVNCPTDNSRTAPPPSPVVLPAS